MLSREIGHRLKNILALVQAIVTQTLRSNASVDEVKTALLLRIHALGKAHEILFETASETAGFRPIVRSAIKLYEDDRQSHFQVSGPEVEINAKSALMLALMIHELATNATKYGALSTLEGRVGLTWGISEGVNPELTFVWEETGGPAVVPPSRYGFGSRLIEQALAGTVCGKARLDYRPTGLVCRLVAP